MKRRSVLQSILAIPVTAVAAAAQTTPAPMAEAQLETPNTPVVPADQTAAPFRRTFTPDQFSALTRLGDLIVPAWNGCPGASEAGAPEFLDFLIGSSAPARRDLYRTGLDTLNGNSQTKFGQPFAALNAQQASVFLSPLSPFLQAAKSDLLRATFNSRPYIDAVAQTRRPRNASKYFWYPIS
jgi:hypothetical protein